MAVWKVYLDESYDNKQHCMIVAGWLATEAEWKRLETDWKKCLMLHNAKNGANHQITRFHASELNGKKAEFKKWDAAMSDALTANLVKVIKRRRIQFVAAGIDVDAIVRARPDLEMSKLESAYGVCVKQIMISLGSLMKDKPAESHVMMVCDSGNFDPDAARAFSQMVHDPKWKYATRFASITPRSGGQEIGLQAADLIAFEVFKRIHSEFVLNNAKLRWALRQFLKASMVGESAWIGATAVKALAGKRTK